MEDTATIPPCGKPRSWCASLGNTPIIQVENSKISAIGKPNRDNELGDTLH